MAKVTPNVASTKVPGIIGSPKVAINPNKSILGVTTNFAGLNPEYNAGSTQSVLPGDHYSTRNGQSGHKVFTNESKRPGTDPLDNKFYAHIA